jgi:hypothetical protein
MKNILCILFIITFSQLGHSQEPPPGMMEKGKPDPAQFEKHKKMILADLDSRIAAGQELKACVVKAKSHEDMKKCRDQEQEKMKKHFQEMQTQAKEKNLDEKIKRLQNEKSKLNEKK